MKYNRSELVLLIHKSLNDISKELDVQIENDVYALLSSPRGQYRGRSVFEVDEERLRETLTGLVTTARASGKITQRDMQSALEKYTCHYLWFC